jgi:hypothetical protein
MLILCVTEGLAPEVALQRIAKIQFIIWMDIKHCHDLLPKKSKTEFCIGVGDRVCGREIYRGNQWRKCYDHPDEKKMREEKKAARPKCTINGCVRNELRSYKLCSKHYEKNVEDAKAKKIDRNRSHANFAEQQSTQ